uniref:MAGE domain-containing protein n=1 Tax=Hucho hucho TaxID=62062 RepID=A0A4W5LKF6_9TELE
MDWCPVQGVYWYIKLSHYRNRRWTSVLSRGCTGTSSCLTTVTGDGLVSCPGGVLEISCTRLHIWMFTCVCVYRSPSNPKTGLLFVILSIVFMKGGVVKENMVWNTLKKLRVDQGERHDIFGDVKKVVTDEFVHENLSIPHRRAVVGR